MINLSRLAPTRIPPRGIRAVILAILTLTGSPLLEAATHTVVLRQIRFEPSRIKIEAGDTIQFINQDPFDHDIYVVDAADRNRVVVPRRKLASGEKVTVKITEKGLFELYCTIHGGMSGKITTTGQFALSAAQRSTHRPKSIPPIAKEGEALFWGKAQCFRCHSIADRGEGTRAPNLQDIGFRANARAEQFQLSSGTDYIIQSLQDPAAHVVEGFSNAMPKVYRRPIGLNEKELTSVIAYLQSLGGTVDTWGIRLDHRLFAPTSDFNPFASGKPEAGKEMFQNAGCYACHAGNLNLQNSPGPKLSAIGRYRNWQWLIQSIIQPNSEIGRNWRHATIELKSGESKEGILRGDEKDAVTILERANQPVRIRREQVQKVSIAKTSKMPANYSEILTYKQISDLIAYLMSLKGE